MDEQTTTTTDLDEAAGCDRCGDTAFADDQLVSSRGQMVCGACAERDQA